MFDVKIYFWDELYLFRECLDHIIRRCVWEEELLEILNTYHGSRVGGFHRGLPTTSKGIQMAITGNSFTRIHMNL